MAKMLNLELTNDVGEIASLNPIPGIEYTKSGKVEQIDITISAKHITIYYLLEDGSRIREDVKRT